MVDRFWPLTALTGVRFQLVLALLTFLALLVFGISAYLYQPYSGLSILSDGQTVSVSKVLPGSPVEQAGLRLMDSLLAVDGQPVDPGLARPIYRPGIRSGESVLFEIDRAGQKFTLTVTMGSHRQNPTWLLTIDLIWLLAALFWGVGVALTLFADPADRRARLVGAAWFLTAFAAAAGGPGKSVSFWGADTVLKTSLVILSFLLVAVHLYFPAPVFSRSVRSLLVHTLFAGSLGLALLVVLGDLGYLPLRNLRPVVLLSFGLAVLAAFLMLLRNGLRTKEVDTRRQTGIIFLGMALSLAPFLMLTLLPYVFLGPDRVFAPGEFTALLFVFIPLTYLYVIRQRSLFQIDFFINRFVVFFVLGLMVLMVSFGLTGILAVRLGWPPALPVVSSLLSLAVFLPSVALQSVVQQWVSRVLYGSDYDPEKVLETISGSLSRTTDRAVLAERLTRDVEKHMGIERTALILAGAPWSVYQNGQLEMLSAAPGEQFAARLLQSKLPQRAEVLAERYPADFEPFRRSFPWVRILVPLVFEKKLRGILVVGRRYNDLYSARDLRILGSAAEQAALALTHVHLLEDYRGLVHQLVYQEEQHRAELARDLHDVVLQDLCYIRQELNPKGVRPDVIGHMETVIDRLRGVISAQQPEISMGGLPAELSQLVMEKQLQVDPQKTRLIYQEDIPVEELDLPDEVAISVYRIAQEGLTNAIRHAQARTITLSLSKTLDNDLVLTVEDDGLGMPEEPPVKSRQYGLENMRERAAMIGASFKIESRPGLGTRLMLGVPEAFSSQA